LDRDSFYSPIRLFLLKRFSRLNVRQLTNQSQFVTARIPLRASLDYSFSHLKLRDSFAGDL
ncbi:MAG: hypothetical protein E7G69_17510, partial [Enterobacter sp.]|nr:hypothetical protein [Enterobacter sp.]